MIFPVVVNLMNMQQLLNSIKSTDEEIEKLSMRICQKNDEITSQEAAYKRAVSDNREKSKIMTACEIFNSVNINDISTVKVSDNSYASIKKQLEDLVAFINTVKVYELDQEMKLNSLKREKADLEKSRTQQQNLKTAYKLQLQVELERQQEALENAKKVLARGEKRDNTVIKPECDVNKQ